ncbi:hypothetical protein GPALN_016368 [Globodera pallida]|nr:hypothetical protein GPALN_016368 [Globodera pallida]
MPKKFNALFLSICTILINSFYHKFLVSDMPKKNHIPTPKKIDIVEAKKNGQTDRAVSAQFGVSHRAVSNIYKRYRAGDDLHRKPRSGRPKKLSIREERIALREIQLDPTKSATDLVNCVATKFDKCISTRTGRRLLNSAQLFAHRPAYKPLLSKKNRLARLDFARSYVNHTPQQWSTVLFSDEAPFHLYNSAVRRFIRRPPQTRYHKRYIVPTVKFGGGTVMVWGCMSRDGLGPLVRIHGTMDRFQYRDIMQAHMLPHLRDKMPPDVVFQQDNDPKHTSGLMMGTKKTFDSRLVCRQWSSCFGLAESVP